MYRAQAFGEIRRSLIRERSGQTGMPGVCTCMYMYLRTESYLRPWIIEFPSVRLDFSTTTRSQRTATPVSENKRVREDTAVIVASTSPGLVYNVSRLRHARTCERVCTQCAQGDSNVRDLGKRSPLIHWNYFDARTEVKRSNAQIFHAEC